MHTHVYMCVHECTCGVRAPEKGGRGQSDDRVWECDPDSHTNRRSPSPLTDRRRTRDGQTPRHAPYLRCPRPPVRSPLRLGIGTSSAGLPQGDGADGRGRRE